MTAPILDRPPTVRRRQRNRTDSARALAERVRADLAAHRPTFVSVDGQAGWCVTAVDDDGLFELYRDGHAQSVPWSAVRAGE